MKSTLQVLAVVCLLALGSFAQLPNAYGDITAAGSACTTANACISLHLPSPAVGQVSIQITNTFVGTAQFEVSNDNGGNWRARLAVPVAGGALASSATSTGAWVAEVGGMTDIRVRSSAYTSGAISVVLQPSNTSGGASSVSVNGTGASAAQVQGAAASGAALAGNPVLVGISDGTNAQNVTQVVNGLNSTGAGIASVGLVGQFDDASTTQCTENQFCVLRLGVSRALLVGGSGAPNSTTNSTITPLGMSTFGVPAIGSVITPVNAVTLSSNVAGPVGSSGSSVATITGGLLVLPRIYNGSTLDMQWYCNKVAKLSALAAATTQIVALSGTTKIYVCSAVISNNNATPTTLKFVEGTGSNCGTGTADLSALMNIGATSTSPISLQYGASGALSTATAGDALCLTSSAASSLEITITYQQF
jgi:hypothetical protein